MSNLLLANSAQYDSSNCLSRKPTENVFIEGKCSDAFLIIEVESRPPERKDEISTSATYNNMQFFVDCETPSGGFKRFRFTESQLNIPSSPAISESDKAYSEFQAAKLCEGLIKNNANYPSTVKANFFNVGYRKFEPLGNVQVSMNFKAKNAFGLELKYKATCLFKPGNPNGEIRIKER